MAHHQPSPADTSEAGQEPEEAGSQYGWAPAAARGKEAPQPSTSFCLTALSVRNRARQYSATGADTFPAQKESTAEGYLVSPFRDMIEVILNDRLGKKVRVKCK